MWSVLLLQWYFCTIGAKKTKFERTTCACLLKMRDKLVCQSIKTYAIMWKIISWLRIQRELGEFVRCHEHEFLSISFVPESEHSAIFGHLARPIDPKVRNKHFGSRLGITKSINFDLNTCINEYLHRKLNY